MKHGRFSDDDREFVITDPHTPWPWHNDLVNDTYLVNLTQLGTGASFYPPTGEGLRTNLTEDRDGLDASWRVFVPENDAVELWTITVANTGDTARAVSVFPYLEMHLTGGRTLMDFIAVLGGFYDEESRAVFGINSCVKFPPGIQGDAGLGFPGGRRNGQP